MTKIEISSTKKLSEEITLKPNKLLVRKLLEKLATKNKNINVKYRGWKNLFYGARKLSIDNITDAIYLLNESRTDKNFVPNLLKSNLLSELSQMKLEKNKHISSLLMSLPYIPDLLSSYGVDELALNRAMYMLEANPDVADKIGYSIADLIQDQSLQNKALLLTKLLDNVLDAAAQNETSHITTAKFMQEFLIKLCNQKLPKNYKFIEELDSKINDPNISAEQKDDYNIVRNDHTAKYSLMETLRYNFRDYIGIIRDLNEKHFLVALTGKDPKNTILLKELNSAFMQYSFNSNNPTQTIDNLKDFIMSAVNLSTGQDAGIALTPLITRELLVKIFDLPGAVGSSHYKDLVLNLANDIDQFQNLAGEILAKKEKLRPAIKDLLDFIYTPEEKVKEKNESFEKSLFSIVDLVAEGEIISKLMPLVNKTLIKDVFKIIETRNQTAVTSEKHSLIKKIAATVQEVINNPDVKKNVSDTERSLIMPILSEITKNHTDEKITSSEISFASRLLSHLIKKLPSEEIKTSLEKNKDNLAIVIDSAIKRLDSLAPILQKCELNGKMIIEFLPGICNKKTLNLVGICIENPSALNISSLLLSEPKIIPYAIGIVVTFCKNHLKDAIYSKKTVATSTIDIKKMDNIVKNIASETSTQTGTLNGKEVNLSDLNSKMKSMTSEDLTIKKEVNLEEVENKTKEVTPKGFIAKTKITINPHRRVDNKQTVPNRTN